MDRRGLLKSLFAAPAAAMVFNKVDANEAEKKITYTGPKEISLELIDGSYSYVECINGSGYYIMTNSDIGFYVNQSGIICE